MKDQRIQAEERGVIALMTVIIIGALVLAVGISVSFIGQTEVIITGDTDREQSLRSLVFTCIEEATFRLKSDPAYVGGTVPIGLDSCAVTVSGSGSTRTVLATATIDPYTKSATASVLLKQNVAGNARGWAVDSWLESDPP